MKALIVKYDTPAGVFSIDEDFNVFLGVTQDYSFSPSQRTLQEAIDYVENKIVQDVHNIREGIAAQIDMLQIQMNAISSSVLPEEYRVKL